MASLLREQMNLVQILPSRLIGDLENGQRRQAHHCKSRGNNQGNAENGTLHFSSGWDLTDPSEPRYLQARDRSVSLQCT